MISVYFMQGIAMDIDINGKTFNKQQFNRKEVVI